jgi:hypothetical protein
LVEIMKSKIIPIFLITIMIFATINFVYADDAPALSQAQAKAIAQDYLNTHGYTGYKAVSTGSLVIKVHDSYTDTNVWISYATAKEDSPDFGGPGRYDKWLSNRAWLVEVNDPDGNSVGKIYVDGDNGKIISTKLPKAPSVTSTNITPVNTTNDTNATQPDSNILQNIWDSIVAFFQQLWIAIFGQ